ncbi:filamentous hemagglutinin family N-terminal domain protein [Rivularia sp. PCC 7116]|uniref:two-partner secretion domain-containing protein n=1 Tax=Rivularia sp. PCC 7116 TaxID=373994 RepID=UPI00029EE438|nr:filamentous hemagglutinin N-terminal domain-containing protein [Rivularia sp. PCC 7116]AFY56419.1 filamentous hemagglutinin family N-terminal domain protein [Rivularia sp. PCC 7116]
MARFTPILHYFLLSSLTFCSLISWKSVGAQIIPDSTLGSESSVITPDTIKQIPGDRIDGGAVRAENLFHSFTEFNIKQGQGAYFSNPSGVKNIFTRVTGNNISKIFGTLGVDGKANLFLLNPNGIIFGKNARLDVNGSFVGSTANAIEFENQGFFSATNPQNASQLLTIKPSAFLFNQLESGRIESSSIAPLEDNLFGLRVPDGRSLLFLGGEIFVNGGWLNAPGGRVELTGVADTGVVGINFDSNNPSLKVADKLGRSNVIINNFGRANVIGDNGGSIEINANNINLIAGYLDAGIAPGLGSDESKAGDITLNAQKSTVIKGITTPEFIAKSRIRNFIYAGATGEGGDIKINTESLAVDDFSSLETSTQSRGNAGRVLIQAKDEVSLREGSTIFNTVSSGGIGNAGGVKIQANSFSLLEGAEIQAGNTGGIGNAGDVNIDVRDGILFDGLYSDGFASGIFNGVTEQGIGDSGEIYIKANSFTLSDGARLQTKSEGQGDTGNVKIDVGDRIVFNGTKTNPDLDFEHLTGIFTTLETKSFRQGGDVNIKTGSLNIINGAEITSNSFGLGNSGNINIEARKDITLDGFNNHGGTSGFFSALGNSENPATGKGGNINISANSLSLTNGATIASTTSTGSQGDAGKINIVTDKQVLLDGAGLNESPGGIFAAVETGAIGNANDIEIKTDLLSVINNSSLSTSIAGKGNAGNIKTEARILEVADGGRLVTTTSGSAKAGNIILSVRDNVILSGSDTGLFANTTEGSSGNGGNIIVEPSKITVRDGAEIAVDSQGQGIGGTVELAADFLTLDNGLISAENRSNTGGNIKLHLQKLLLLRNGSQISSTAGNREFGGDGGNININAPNGFVVAVPKEDSDITANAFRGNGGKVEIFTQGIFGIRFQEQLTQKSDITASSRFGVRGNVALVTLEIDPTSGLIELPANLVDAANQISNACTPGSREFENSLVSTGRGGLPMSPTEPLQENNALSAWVRLKPELISRKNTRIKPRSTTVSNSNNDNVRKKNQIVEATGWIVDKDGSIEFVAQAHQKTSHNPRRKSADCYVRSATG